MEDDERRERRGDRDRDRDRWEDDVRAEKPSKIFREAAEDVKGGYRVAQDIARDTIREKWDARSVTEIYDRILAAREL